MDVHQHSSTHAVLLQSWPTPNSITSVISLLLPSSCNKVYILTLEMLSYLQLCVAPHSCQPQAHSGSLSAQPQYHVAFELLGLHVFNDPASSCRGQLCRSCTLQRMFCCCTAIIASVDGSFGASYRCHISVLAAAL